MLLIALLTGCDADCENSSRISGDYAMWHTVLNVGEEGAAEVDDTYPSYEMFINGWSRWDLTWLAGSSTMNVEIRDVAERAGTEQAAGVAQTYNGTLGAAKENCNLFEMGASGEFTAAGGTIHTFTYTSAVVFQGDGFSGSFTYEDSYSGFDSAGAAISGGLTGATGEVIGVLQAADTFDTGFGE